LPFGETSAAESGPGPDDSVEFSQLTVNSAATATAIEIARFIRKDSPGCLYN
jgi:hypothetical protein